MRNCGDWRAVIPKVVDQFLACGLLEHGFARIRCDACAHEYLLTLTIDHRVLDGYQAKAFLAPWVEEIEGWR